MKTERASFFALLAIICLSPLAFLSPKFLLPEYVKMAVIALGAFVSAISLVYAFWHRKSITIPKHPALVALLAIDIIVLLSAFSGGALKMSFFGQGIEIDTASTLLLMSLVFLLIVIIARNVNRIF